MTEINHMMVIGGHLASVSYEAEIKSFRGKFLDLNGYCDFVSNSIEGLKKEGAISLAEFVATCSEENLSRRPIA